jgi:hypothetical protein
METKYYPVEAADAIAALRQANRELTDGELLASVHAPVEVAVSALSDLISSGIITYRVQNITPLFSLTDR